LEIGQADDEPEAEGQGDFVEDGDAEKKGRAEEKKGGSLETADKQEK
jgi:hypothetical protein